MDYSAVTNSIQKLNEATSSKIGQEYFEAVVEYLAKALAVDYVFIGELADNRTSIDTLVVCAKGHIVENITYDLLGTPCEKVAGHQSCFYPDNAQKLFPNDHLLEEMGVISYLGAPLFSSSGKPIGIIVALDSKPMTNNESIQAYFDLVTGRIAAEYERRSTLKLLERQEKRFRDLITCSSDFIWEVDENLIYTFSTSSAEGTLGYLPSEMIGKKPFDFMPKEEAENVANAFKPFFENRESFTGLENKIIGKDGKLVHIETSGVPIFNEQGEFKGYRGIDTDISERKNRELELSLSATVLDTASEAVMVTDSNNQIIKINRAFSKITGYSEEEVLAKTPSLLKSGYHDEMFYQNLHSSLESNGKWQGEIWNKRKNDDIYPQWLSITKMDHDQDEHQGFVSVFSDITVRKEHEEKIEYQANFDALTGLANRNLMEDRFRMAMHHAEREDKKVALLFIDLDRFKQINDSLGHFVGDKLLKEVAHRIANHIRRSDTAARLGGDEFAVIIPEITSVVEVDAIVRKLISSISMPFNLDPNELYISASIGVTLYPNDGAGIKELLRNADNAMYKAKENGRDTYQFYTQEMHEESQRRHELENELHKAVLNEDFTLHYQPIVDSVSRKPIGCEALLRWSSDSLGDVSPAEFIPLAEETGLIETIGTWVLNEACDQFSKLPVGFPDDFFVSINVSSYQFQAGRFLSRVKDALNKTQLLPHNLVIEITERLMLTEDNLVLSQLEAIRELGVRLSIDDFGTGYSSLSYLNRYPMSSLKIDRSFIIDLDTNVRNQALVKAIIAMSESLGMSTVAEGIEEPEQAEFLQKNNCSSLQGFMFSKPKPFKDLANLVCNCD
ncbi:MAG: bifunctional diguanylate cyclase/phosphodiesterase [Neptuniibacter sp.]